MTQDIERLFAPNLDFLKDNDNPERDISAFQRALDKAKTTKPVQDDVQKPIQEPVQVEPEVKEKA